MSISLNTGTGGIPLKFARELSALVNNEWESGNFINKELCFAWRKDFLQPAG